MQIVDFYPTRGMFRPGEVVGLNLEVQADLPGPVEIELSIHHLHRRVHTHSLTKLLPAGASRIGLEWAPPAAAGQGYGAAVRLVDAGGACTARTAFDVLERWTDYPRYGFLTDFTPGRADLAQTLEKLAKYHLNGLQFYDWQYRHDQLVPPVDEFIDPLGRQLSLPVVRSAVDQAHAAGMAAMPYLAVYAASLEFAHAHPDWALYQAEGTPHVFAGFLGLMDPSPDGPWSRHLQNECTHTLAALPFDGLHIDQYGEPKTAFDARGAEVDLPAAFVELVRAVKTSHPDGAVVFNAVGNWPVDALAGSMVDFVYIEVWPPATGYADLLDIVVQARRKSGDKPVVIALYIPAEQVVNIRLADALILAAGGTRIELGEDERLLSDPYFPKHEALSAGLRETLRGYADFAVRYGEWCGPSSRNLEDPGVQAPPGVQVVARQSGEWTLLHLVNFSGLEAPRWDQPQPGPVALGEFEISLPFGPVGTVLWASPDRGEPALQPAAWQQTSERVVISLPGLNTWSLVAIHTVG